MGGPPAPTRLAERPWHPEGGPRYRLALDSEIRTRESLSATLRLVVLPDQKEGLS